MMPVIVESERIHAGNSDSNMKLGMKLRVKSGRDNVRVSWGMAKNRL